MVSSCPITTSRGSRERSRYGWRSWHPLRFWEYVSAGRAVRFLDEYCHRTTRSFLEPKQKVTRMLREHGTLILNWFHARGTISAGVVESFNIRAKLTIKMGMAFAPIQR